MTGSLFQTLFNIVDTFYAGKISPDALAALAKAFPLYFLIISAGIGIVAGCNSLNCECNRYKKYFVSIYLFLSFNNLWSFTINFNYNYRNFFFRGFVKIHGQLISKYNFITKEYIDIIFYGTIVFLILTALNSILYAQGDTKTYRNVLFFGVIANIILNPIFIFGFLFIPSFGIAGLAISTVMI